MRQLPRLLVVITLVPACWAKFPDALLDPDTRSDDFGVSDRSVPDTEPPKDARSEPTTDLPQPDVPRPDLIPADAAAPDAPQGILALGAACKKDSDCWTGLCVDGVCCNAPCTGTCVACDSAGKLGQCLPVPAGQDPKNQCAPKPRATCKQDGACDGKGACRLWPGDTICQDPLCSGSGQELVSLPSLCDGAGTCVPLGTIACSPYKCDPTTRRCHASCTGSGAAQCISGKPCVAGQCDARARPRGVGCTNGTECESGLCVDGVCCDGQCVGPCETCKLTVTTSAGSYAAAGKCIKVPAGSDPDSECTPTAAATCGQDGTCDGSGACRLHPSGTVCKARVCNSTTSPHQLEPHHRCNGGGACLAVGSATSCGDYLCMSGGQSCFGQCLSSAQCGPSASCNLSSNNCQ
jgi:hypothetical protein